MKYKPPEKIKPFQIFAINHPQNKNERKTLNCATNSRASRKQFGNNSYFI